MTKNNPQFNVLSVSKLTIEHALFLYQFFKRYSIKDFTKYLVDVSAVSEIRDKDENLIACGTLEKHIAPLSEDDKVLYGYLGFSAVSEDFRKLGLQRLLIKDRVEIAKTHNVSYIEVMVRISNIASLRNLLHEGFLPIECIEYNDLEPGYILRKTLS